MTQTSSNGRLAKLLIFFAGSGILVALLQTAYQYIAGNVSLEFVQPVGRAYEFQLKNDTPSDRTVRLFRIDPPRVQNLPGGNVSYVPAAEFKELDGQRLPANASLKFRVPPLSSRSWMAPEAVIVDIRYELESSNPALSIIETLLNATGVRPRERTVRYLVVENYWTLSQSASLHEAIRVFCRDNDEMAKSSICTTRR